jgi:hydroxymethylbilane synthase
VRIGTRGSALALVQAGLADAALGGGHDVVPITTHGDRHREAEDKAKWVRELERALLDGTIDVAVHSAKDVPAELPDGLALVGTLPREDPRDALCGRLEGRVGTASPRRAAQLRALRPDLEITDVRGNVDTRLRKLAAGEVDGLVLAVAGLTRLGREEAIDEVLDLLPAAGQGTVVLEARAGTVLPADGLDAGATWTSLAAERALVRTLGADCHSAVGAHATAGAGGATLTLRAWVGAADGGRWITDALDGAEPDALGVALAERLLRAGAGDLLR